MEVVFPAPFTPASMMIKGLCVMVSSGCDRGSSNATSASCNAPLSSTASVRPLRLTCLRSSSSPCGRAHAGVGREQDGFQLLIERFVDLAAAEEAG